VKQDEKKRKIERESRRITSLKSPPSVDPSDKLSMVLEIEEDDFISHSPSSDSETTSVVAIGGSFLAIDDPEVADLHPIASSSSIATEKSESQRPTPSSAFPNAVVSVLERRNQAGSVSDFERSLVTSLSPIQPESGSATFKKAASLFLKRPVQSPISDSGLRQRRGRAGSLVGSEVKNLTEVNLCVVDWKYKSGAVKLPKPDESRPSTNGGLGGLAVSDDEDDLDVDERGEKNGWRFGDKLNLRIAIRNEKEFRRLLKVLSEFEG
jgi:hypothetical protein